MQAPTIEKDPAQEILKKQAENDKIKAIQEQLGSDTAAMMRRYGRGPLGLAGGSAGLPLFSGDMFVGSRAA